MWVKWVAGGRGWGVGGGGASCHAISQRQTDREASISAVIPAEPADQHS